MLNSTLVQLMPKKSHFLKLVDCFLLRDFRDPFHAVMYDIYLHFVHLRLLLCLLNYSAFKNLVEHLMILFYHKIKWHEPNIAKLYV